METDGNLKTLGHLFFQIRPFCLGKMKEKEKGKLINVSWLALP